MSDEEQTKENVTESSEKNQEKSDNKPKTSKDSNGLTAYEVSELVEAEEKAAQARLAAAKKALETAAKEEYEAAAAEVTAKKTDSTFTNKRAQEVIFRRELGEPEFWLPKEKLTPPRPILTPEEEEVISRRVEIPIDNTPQYQPQHMLSPEFNGTSNYERGVADFRHELEEKLQNLKSNPNATEKQITQTQEDLKTLDYLYENFYQGMNVFRTAKGGRKNATK